MAASKRARWAGLWLIGTAVVHTLFALWAFSQPISDMVREGLWHTVKDDALRGAVAWFVLAGLLLALCGWALFSGSTQSAQAWYQTEQRMGGALLGWAVLGIVLMPVSGVWLLLPPALMLLRQPTRHDNAADLIKKGPV